MTPEANRGVNGMNARVLVVSDDPAALLGLRRMLDPLAREWEILTERGAKATLARLDLARADVLIVDRVQAEMRRDDLLVEVRRRFPSTVRVVLVDATEQGELARLAALSHRVLAKPVDSDELQTVVRRTHSLRELLRSPSLTAVVGRMGTVPALSDLYTRIAEELAYPDYSLAAVGALVSQDVGIAAKLIQMANSALLGLRRPAGSPAQAVRVLGADLTRTLVLAADLFSRYNPATLRPFSIDALWDHSRQIADLASRIATAERAGERTVRDAALAGLFHDIGQLTMVSQLPGPYREVFELRARENLTTAAAEKRVFGATHAEVGGYLLGLWGLHDSLVEAVAWHHEPSGCPGNTFSALTAVHVADAITRAAEGARPDRDYLARLGMEDRLLEWIRISEQPPTSN